MKTYLKSALLAGAMAIASFSFGQLQDEQDVTITMDLQPILQLKMEGPDQIDFTFDEINKYYTGIMKPGANILKVSASVSFDLWAVGLSTGSIVNNGLIWDNPVTYGVGALTPNALNRIPLTALELHQFPQNPAVATCATIAPVAPATTRDYDYFSQFAPFSFATNGIGANATNVAADADNLLGNNTIYCQTAQLAYSRPTTVGANTDEKYIAGAGGTVDGCQINAGSYLFGSISTVGAIANSNNQQTSGGYYFVMDYRILPGLPARFPATVPANNVNAAALYLVAAAATGNVTSGPNTFAAPGVYTMYVKYILQEDQ